MRFKKLTIRNYRGVDEATVAFAETGITLVHGPNETGKSSLAEAIATLFKHKSSTTRVKNIKPVDKDAGPSIELEATSGDYHFTYAKRFLKKHATTLTVHRPSAENLTGDQAHERVEAILKATLRKELWDTLFSQKKDVDLLVAEGNAALMRSLDAAADGDGGDDPSEGIYERVREYYHRFFAKNHREKSELAGARARLEQATAEAARLEKALADIEAKTKESAALRHERGRVAGELAGAQTRLGEKKALVSELASLRAAMNDAKMALTAANAEALVAERELRERQRLINAADKAMDALIATDEAVLNAPDVEALGATLADATQMLRDAEAARKAADELAALTWRDCEYFQKLESLVNLQAGAARLDAARGEAEAAQKQRDENPVTQAAVRDLRKAEAAVARLEEILARDAPRVVLTGLGDVEATVGDETLRLKEGERREYSVADSLAVTLPLAVRVEILSGSAVGEERIKLDGAAQTLHRLLAAAGCASVEEAEQKAERRAAAEATLADVSRRLAGEPPADELRTRIATLEQALTRYREARSGLAPLPENLDAAILARSHAESAALSAQDALASAQAGEAQARQRRDAASTAARDARLRRELAEKAQNDAQCTLETAREITTDAELDAAWAAKNAAMADALAHAETSEKAWLARDPEGEAERLGALEELVRNLTDEVRDIEGRQRELAGELRALGEAGLYEIKELALADVDSARLALESLQAKANAAKMLYETMTAARDRIRHDYQQPLKTMLEELGRDVFGPGFQVGISDALAIETRTVDGVTVPYADLSSGAKEQLLLLYRAACAIMVSEEEGMPILLDDVLGHSDSERLRLVGKALETAAERCQVVIFTCMPDRYAGLRGVTTVGLGND